MIHHPERVVGAVALAFMAIAFLARAFVRVLRSPTSPNPWDKEIDKALREPDAMQVCHRCFEPVAPAAWFCTCGCAVGRYNNLMPYVSAFSQGEVLRNGVYSKLPNELIIFAGYFLISFHYLFILAPVYWILLFNNLNRESELAEDSEPGDE
jgi:hypothetical protein